MVIATEAEVFTRYVLLLRQNAGLNLHHCPNLSCTPVPADDQHLLSYGLRPALPEALLPRDRKTAPETPCLSTAPEPVRHFNRAERESDARNLSDLPQRNQLRQPMTEF